VEAFVVVWIALLSSAGALFAYALASVDALPRPALGRRGASRRRAMSESALLRLGEPALRQLGAWLAPLVPLARKEAIERRLDAAGSWLGIGAEELLGLSLACAVAGGNAAALTAVAWDASVLWSVPAGLAGAALPWARLRAAGLRRAMAAERELPGAIELLSLCLSAGADFPAALRLTLGAGAARSAIVEELSVVQQDLALGRTRVEALRELARRLPCEAVHGFVTSVIQAEEKGTPLAATLRIQAEVLRARRGVLAEEAAAHAGVLMVLPLLLLLACVLLLLFGPFVVGGGLG
jgi:tight adherence protein C